MLQALITSCVALDRLLLSEASCLRNDLQTVIPLHEVVKDVHTGMALRKAPSSSASIPFGPYSYHTGLYWHLRGKAKAVLAALQVREQSTTSK